VGVRLRRCGDLACGGLVKILDGGGPKFIEDGRNLFLDFFFKFSGTILGKFP
jgi:hypothetical protein